MKPLYTLYSHFNIQATVNHVSDIDNHKGDGNLMAVSTAVADDKTSFATITVFLQLTKEITDRKSYQFINECGFTDECGSL